MKRVLFTTLVAVACCAALGQTAPSPASLSSIKNINLPVNKYNGTASVSVPLYRAPLLNGGSIPVGLQYNTSGIKVGEQAGPVGLGWQLIAGGKITRIMMGHPDEISAYNTDETLANLANTAIGYQDTEKDVFYFEYPGGGGRFLFGDGFYAACAPTDCSLACSSTACLENYNDCMRASSRACNGGPITFDSFFTIPNTDITIAFHYTDKLNSYFTITDTYGNRFIFGDHDNAREVTIAEKSQPNVSTYDPALREEYISTWHLTEIDHAQLPDTENTEFSYGTHGQSTVVSEGGEIDFIVKANYGNGSIEIEQDVENTYTGIDVKRLTRIRTSKARIEFGYEDRLDISGGKKLTTLTLYDKANKAVSATTFEYAVNLATTSYNYQQIYDTPPAPGTLKRLMLKSVEKDGLTVRKFSYQNEKSDDDDNVFQLPPRGSYYTDHWGYNNSGDHHQTYVPYPSAEEIDYDESGGSSTFVLAGMDKTSSLSAKANILTEVYHPSGGYTKFLYGIHPNGGGVRISHVENYNEYDVKVQGTRYDYFDSDPANFVNDIEPAYFKYIDTKSNKDIFVVYPQAESLIYDLNGAAHGYRKVKEVNQLTGAYTIHYYQAEYPGDVTPEKNQYTIDLVDGSLIMNALPSSPFQSPYSSHDLTYYNKGTETKMEIYDEGGNLVSETTYNYIHTPPKYSVSAMNVELFKSDREELFNIITSDTYTLFASKYQIAVKTLQLHQRITKVYDQGGEVADTTTFYYSHPYETLPYQLMSSSSTGYVSRKNIRYPFSNNQDVLSRFEDPTILNAMLDNRMVAVPVMEINEIKYPNYSTFKTSGAQLTTFKGFGTQILPHQSYSLAMNEPGVFNNAHFVLVNTNDYNDNGQLKSQTGRSSIEKTYDYDVYGDLAKLTIHNGIPGQERSTNYTYNRLIGLKNITGPDGRSSSFEYDELNRVHLVRNQDNHIVKRYQYNYAGKETEDLGEITASLVVSYPRLKNASVSFNATEINMYGGASSATYQWNIDNGAKVSNQQSTNHTFTQAGSYSASFTIDNPEYAGPQTINVNYQIHDNYWGLNDISGIGQACALTAFELNPPSINYQITSITGAADCFGAGPITYEWTYSISGGNPVVFGNDLQASLPGSVREFPGDVAIVVTASDNCGRTVQKTKTLTVLPYSQSSCGGGNEGGEGGEGEDDDDGSDGGGNSSTWTVNLTGNGDQVICETGPPDAVTFGSYVSGLHMCGTPSLSYNWEYEVNGQTYPLGGGSQKTITRDLLFLNGGSANDVYLISISVSDGCGETKESNTMQLTFMFNC